MSTVALPRPHTPATQSRPAVARRPRSGALVQHVPARSSGRPAARAARGPRLVRVLSTALAWLLHDELGARIDSVPEHRRMRHEAHRIPGPHQH